MGIKPRRLMCGFLGHRVEESERRPHLPGQSAGISE